MQDARPCTPVKRGTSMGFARNLGAYATFGLAATTNQKETEREYEERRQRHQNQLAVYNDLLNDVREAVDAMMVAYGAAQEALLDTGALQTTEDNTVDYGWYKRLEDGEPIDGNPDYTRTAIGAIPAFGLGVGAPAAVWTLVSIYGTAATGTAIGATTGAATITATAAWIGRAVTFGRGGMMAGGLAIGPLALAGSALTLPLGVFIAHNKEKNYIRQAKEAMGKMDELQEILVRSQTELKKRCLEMTLTTDKLQRLTTQLLTATPDAPQSRAIVSDLDDSMRSTKARTDDLERLIRERDDAIDSAGLSDEEQRDTDDG